MRIPIFIIVHDRITVLKKTVKSFDQIKTPHEIIFHDVSSTYPDCLKYLEEMKNKGYRVYRSEKNHHHTVMTSIQHYLAEHPECQYYVLTDPDVELDNVNEDILDYYIWLIENYGKHLVVGPMLRIDDIPDYYPRKQLAIKLHTQQFWHKQPIPIEWKGNTCHIQHSLIDTTFQLVHRDNNQSFPRPGIRCYAPYSARHLDWYIDPNDMNDDQKYYSSRATQIAHWGRNIK